MLSGSAMGAGVWQRFAEVILCVMFLPGVGKWRLSPGVPRGGPETSERAGPEAIGKLGWGVGAPLRSAAPGTLSGRVVMSSASVPWVRRKGRGRWAPASCLRTRETGLPHVHPAALVAPVGGTPSAWDSAPRAPAGAPPEGCVPHYFFFFSD